MATKKYTKTCVHCGAHFGTNEKRTWFCSLRCGNLAKPKKPSHSKLVQRADKLFSLIVRSVGRCESGRPNHAGPLQCAHGFSRRYEGTRWNRYNAFCLCAGCHVYFTHRPLEWDDWLLAQMGECYGPLRNKALLGGKQDMEQVIAFLERKEAALPTRSRACWSAGRSTPLAAKTGKPTSLGIRRTPRSPPKCPR